MSPRTEKFFVGFFGTLVLAVICLIIVGIEGWLFINFGPLWAVVTIVLIVALFAGFMHASAPEKETTTED